MLSTTLLMMAIIGTLTFEFQVSLPLLARFQFNGDASSYALLSASLGAGAVIGGLLIAGQRRVSHDQLVRGALLFGLAVTASAFMPSLWLSAAALVVVGVCSIAFTSLGNSLLQLESNPQMRGRVMAFWSIAVLGSSTIGGPIVGWVGQLAGARWGLAIGGLAAVVAAGLGAWRLAGQRRASPPELAQEAGPVLDTKGCRAANPRGRRANTKTPVSRVADRVFGSSCARRVGEAPAALQPVLAHLEF